MLGERHAEVLELIKARRASGYDAGSMSDGNRLCLVVQGGGMRGILGSAAAVALDQLGIAGSFDAMYGTSAGGLTVAYLAAGQIAYGTSIYYQNLAGHTHFIDPWRLSGPMDVGFLFDQWITKGKALDTDAVKASPVRIGVATTDAADGSVRVFDNRELTGAKFVAALRASASMPLFSNNREIIRGREYNDAFSRRAELYNAIVDRLYGPGYGIPTLIVAPRDPATVPSNRETDPDILVAAAEASLRRMERAFDAAPGSTKLYFAPEGLVAYPDVAPRS